MRTHNRSHRCHAGHIIARQIKDNCRLCVPRRQETHSKRTELKPIPERLGEFATGSCARAMAQQKTVFVDGLYSDVEFVPWHEVAHSGAYQGSTPLSHERKTIGGLISWFSPEVWKPWRCVPLAEELAATTTPLWAKIYQASSDGTMHKQKSYAARAIPQCLPPQPRH